MSTASDYIPVPVAAAAAIAANYAKQVVVIVSLDRAHDLVHTTTFGERAGDKLVAAETGDAVARLLADFDRRTPFEDWRLLDLARLKEENDALRRRVAELEGGAG